MQTTTSKQIEEASLVDNIELSPGLHELVLYAPRQAALARPGQFAHLKCGPDWDPLLRRPLSYLRMDASAGSVAVMLQVVGRGTARLAGLRGGDTVSMLGPLGRGFNIVTDVHRHLLVAGGVGIVPLLPLAQAIQRLQASASVELHYGGRDAAHLPYADEFEQLGCRVMLATDDGSAGQSGLVTTTLPDQLADAAVYACGPNPMLAAVQTYCAERSLVCQLSLERRMGCGVGVCLGCVVDAHCEGEGVRRLRTCFEGPVFRGDEVVL